MKRCRVEHIVLTTPDQQRRQRAGGKLAFQPGEAVERARRIIQRDPARPCPGEQAGRGIRQHRFVGRLRALLEALAIDHREINAAPGQRIVPPQQIRSEQRRVHHAPGKNPRVELGRRQRPGPCAHQHQRFYARDIRQREAKPGRAAPIMADQRDAVQIQRTQQSGEVGDMAIEAVRLFAHRLFRQPEADHVGDDDATASRGQRRDEVPIQEAPGRIAVQQHDRIAGALIDIVHPPAIHPCEMRPERPLPDDGFGQVESSHVAFPVIARHA